MLGALVGAAGLAVGGAGGMLGLGPAAPAAADPIGTCSSSAGVLVVVDFGHWGGPTDLGCAPSSGTGYTALAAAGFITAGTQEEGPAFVCRIGLATEGAGSFEPTPSEDPCVNTPPVSAYWSYWHADAGQDTWSYSQQGVMSYRPPPGSIDAWTFGAASVSGTTGQPPFSPDQVRAAARSGGSGSITPAQATSSAGAPPGSQSAAGSAPGAAPATSSPSAQTARAGGTGSAPATAAAGSTGAAGTTGAAGSTGPAGATAANPGTAGHTVSAPAPAPAGTGQGRDHGAVPVSSGRRPAPSFRIVASPAGSPSSRSGSPGPPLASIVGLVAVAVLGGAGGIVAWRRRRTG